MFGFNTPMDLGVGTRVRVMDKVGEARHLATVSYIHSNHEVDVFYDTYRGNHGEEEECNVHMSRLRPLEAFESPLVPSSSPSSIAMNTIAMLQVDGSEWKDRGNALFALKDYTAASHCYGAALRILHLSSAGLIPTALNAAQATASNDPLAIQISGGGLLSTAAESNACLRVGADVFVMRDKMNDNFVRAMITSIEFPTAISTAAKNAADFAAQHGYDPTQASTVCAALLSMNRNHSVQVEIVFEDDTEITVPASACEYYCGLDNPSSLLIERSAYLNLAKCAMKRGLKGWCVRYASLALAIAEAIAMNFVSSGIVSMADARKYIADALFVRAKALVAALRTARASMDAQALSNLDPSRGNSLMSEIAACREKRRRGDRKLAKEIAKWVDQAMEATSRMNIGEEVEDLETVEEEDF